jgi:hypothetical protein
VVSRPRARFPPPICAALRRRRRVVVTWGARATRNWLGHAARG